MAASPPVLTMQSGAIPPDQGQQQQQPATNVEYGPQNPLHGDQEALERLCGLTKEEAQRIVSEIVQPIRTSWSTDRIMKMPNWLKSTEYDKGKQILGWDPASRTYFDAIAYARQQNQETDYSYLEKYVNNITQTCRRNFAVT